MEGFPSGQREQTVNLSSMTSVVRIHHLPPNARTYRKRCVLFVLHIDIILNCYGYCAILFLLVVLAEPRKASKRRPKGERKKTPSATGRNRFPEGILHYIFRFATTRSPGAYFSHFPLIRRAAKQIARHIQSPTMAIQMPIAPIPK